MRHLPNDIMFRHARAIAVAASVLLGVAAATSPSRSLAAKTDGADPASASSTALRAEILQRDAELSAAYNDCKTAALRAMFATSAELYFAERGATAQVFEHIDQVRRDVCGRFRREAPADAQQVYALPGHLGAIDGAIQVGTQSFCAIDSRPCRGTTTRFVAVWKRRDGEWKIARLLRYGYGNTL